MHVYSDGCASVLERIEHEVQSQELVLCRLSPHAIETKDGRYTKTI